MKYNAITFEHTNKYLLTNLKTVVCNSYEPAMIHRIFKNTTITHAQLHCKECFVHTTLNGVINDIEGVLITIYQ